ncbi:mutarotase [Hymenobacter sp. 5516J-16]|uniref:2'-5' RNA ligase family protein n=1 Tax=Hymenobacter sp. 5516J-16 TaxID=2932253 RepID=UPI001FCFFB94|nr:mutarotase [Hymenobacter sp. 5516J-16]UOQ76990.1 mutarotase [Hymenobacter sp. 5516J-16]
MSLQEHYDAMRTLAVRQLLQGEAELDLLLEVPEQDSRRGLTLLARPPAAVTARIAEVLATVQRAEPDQYYYPASDTHLTILSIISCYPGFSLHLVDSGAYRQLVGAALRAVGPFRICYAGLTVSAGGIMVQGFPEDDSLEKLRNALRVAFRHSGLPQSIDQRYALRTAHSTVVRFTTPLRDPAHLVALVQQEQQTRIGSFEVDTLELVFNDWYQRAANTVQLEQYRLPYHP